jgi:hypothetical protein
MRNDRWPYRFKQRMIVFLRKDEAIFSEALRESFPHVMFLSDFWDGEKPYGSLFQVPTIIASILFPEDGDWRPMPAFDPETGERNGYVGLDDNRSLQFLRGGWDGVGDFHRPGRARLAYDPPTPMLGNIQGSYSVLDPGSATFLSITRKVWKIIGRIATNRVKFGHPLGNVLEGREYQPMADAKGHTEWFGHSALEWCRDGIRRGERRMLCGNRRPADDWELPIDSWYQSLRRRVEDRYGHALDDPPLPPDI